MPETNAPNGHTNGGNLHNAGDVAIIGMAVRAAGDCTTTDKLWKALLEKRVASGEVPAERWEPWYRRDPRNAKALDETITKGYFLDDLGGFDAAFFNISPREAEQMDPHQRLGLELSWEALEDAGLDPKQLAKSNTAVYLGVDSDDYSRLLLEDLPNIEAWMGIGTAAHGIPNRVSYHLDLMGPSAAVDAACASSLVAVHLGRQAIATGESNVAIVGGVNVLVAPALTCMLGTAGALSPDGVCRSFDDKANGYARGEGGAVLILKNLAAAEADGDNILSVIKGSAVAQDGKTDGIMAPNAKAQELVGCLALANGGVEASTVGYVEAHATSTALGDPTEITAIQKIYGVGRTKQDPVFVGSIKPNVGHLEAAAGAIGLIKAVLAVQKGEIPPQANLETLNSKIDWDSSGLSVVRDTTPWPRSDQLRRAAVCCYGYGGTVSHVVIEQSPPRSITNGHEHSTHSDREAVVLTLSAPQSKRLPSQAAALASWLSSDGASVPLAEIANTLAQRRAHFDHRAAFVVKSHAEASEALEAFSAARECSSQGRVLASNRGAVWVFSGHGAQWKAMGKGLLQNTTFRDAITPLSKIVEAEAGFSAVEALATGDFEDVARVQILTYIVQVGLTQVLLSKGIYPQAIIGHSVGEIAASVAAGCLTPAEGTVLVTRRALLYLQVRQNVCGGMALVGLPFHQAQARFDCDELVAAIDSSPASCVISGESSALKGCLETLKSEGIRALQVKTDVAFHSPLVAPLEAPLREALAGSISPGTTAIPVYSTSHQDPRTAELRDIDYWVNNMIKPVRFASAVRAAAEDGYRTFVEISSHPIVTQSVVEILSEFGLDDDAFAPISIMRRDTSVTTSIPSAVAELYTSGASIDFGKLYGHKRLWSSKVPYTPWVHKNYWRQVETGAPTQHVGKFHDVKKHTLLGDRIPLAGSSNVLYTTKLDDQTKPFPGSHPLQGVEIIPAAVYINTFHHATGARRFSDVKLKVPVTMGAETRDIQVFIEGQKISIASSASPTKEQSTKKATWVNHSSCEWGEAAERPSTVEESTNVEVVKARIGKLLPTSFATDYLAKIGVEGIAFPWCVLEHYGNETEMMVKIDTSPGIADPDWDPNSWAPILDAATSVGSTIFWSHDQPQLRIVSGMDEVTINSTSPPPKISYLHVQEATDDHSLAAHVNVLQEDGTLLARFQSMRFSDAAVGSSSNVDSLAHHITWVVPKFSEKPLAMEQILLVSPVASILDSYLTQLRPLVSGNIHGFANSRELQEALESGKLDRKQAVVIYMPGPVSALKDVANAVEENVWETTSLVKLLVKQRLSMKLFVITSRAYAGESPTALAHHALYGLGRIIASEHGDVWGGLIDNDNPTAVPLLALKYVRGRDVIRMIDGLPRCALTAHLTAERRIEPESGRTLLPRPDGTYILTGAFGDLGLETMRFLVRKGARRIVAISRRGLPAREEWLRKDDKFATTAAIQCIFELEQLGASVHVLALDVSSENAGAELVARLRALQLPPVRGVVHAAGILEPSLLLGTTHDDFRRGLAPKVSGALALHEAFPPRSIDFFVLYSSIGQLVGTAGQAVYASSNAFLDGFAAYRRAQGDNTMAFQITAVRGTGMANVSDVVAVEMQSKGIADVTPDQVFQVWEHMSEFDVEGAVITRLLPLEHDEASPVPLFEGTAIRKEKPDDTKTTNGVVQNGTSNHSDEERPKDPAQLSSWLGKTIRDCIALTLKLDGSDEVDEQVALSDMGVDSVLSVALRQKLQSTLKVKVPATLIWNHPTVKHLTTWFADSITGAA